MRTWKTISGCALSVLGLMLFSFSFSVAAAPSAYVEYRDGKVWVRGLEPEALYTFKLFNNANDDWKSVFRVTTSRSRDIGIDGDYEVFVDAVSFTPRFPFVPHVTYWVRFYQEALSTNLNEVYLPAVSSEMLEFSFDIKPTFTTAPKVIAVFPSADILPENTLKFHIVFSESMTKGELYHRVTLLDHEGKVVEKAFLIVDEELWDEEMKAVTIMFDPGRIKRGLRANTEMGSPLRAGGEYVLQIKDGWPDQYGNRTSVVVRKKFKCISADRKIPDVREWIVVKPVSRRGILSISMGESFDADLLLNAVRIKDSQGHLVKGRINILDQESKITFERDEPWDNDEYTIEFNPLLEDLAGNNLFRLFDEDTTRQRSILFPEGITFRLTALQP